MSTSHGGLSDVDAIEICTRCLFHRRSPLVSLVYLPNGPGVHIASMTTLSPGGKAASKSNNTMRFFGPNEIVSAEVYNGLLQNFVRVKREHKILKTAVKECKAENESMSENMYKQAKAKRELEQEKKAAEEENR